MKSNQSHCICFAAPNGDKIVGIRIFYYGTTIEYASGQKSYYDNNDNKYIGPFRSYTGFSYYTHNADFRVITETEFNALDVTPYE